MPCWTVGNRNFLTNFLSRNFLTNNVSLLWTGESENYVELREKKNVLLNVDSDSNYMEVVFVCMCFFGLMLTHGKTGGSIWKFICITY